MKRNFVYAPELSVNTFLFFYYEGDLDSRSYSLRDYSQPGLVRVRYAHAFPYTAGEILQLCARAGNYRFPAPTRRTEDLANWHKDILDLNKRYLNGSSNTERPELADLVEGASETDVTREEIVSNATDPDLSQIPPQPDTDAANSKTITEPEVRKCACGCGQPVNEHAYVWGHKSGSRVNTIPMGAKALPANGAQLGKASGPLVMQLQEQINQFKEKITKLEEAIKALQN